MFLSTFAIKRPVTTLIIFIALISSGLYSYFSLGRNLFPRVSFPILSVTYLLPGVSSKVLEKTVVPPVEEALSSLPGLKHLHVVSLSGVVSLTAIFSEHSDPRLIYPRLQEKVESVSPSLPSGTAPPIISVVNPTSLPLLWVILPIPDSMDSRVITDWAMMNLVTPIRKLSGVADVKPIFPAREVLHISLHRKELTKYLVPVTSVLESLKKVGLSIPAGTMTSGKEEIMVETLDSESTVASLSSLPVPDGKGRTIPLSRIATISIGPVRETEIFRIDGTRAIGLRIFKKKGADGLSLSGKIRKIILDRKAVAAVSGVNGQSIVLDPVIRMDRSEMIRKNNRELLETLLFGGALTVLVIWIFLGSFKTTMIASISIPSSVIATFLMMKMAHFSLNNMTMLGLSLVVGILVDDAIVVLENIHRHGQMGKPFDQAVSDGVGEIGMAVMATTFSIISVFAPVAFMHGIIGKFFFEFGLTVSFAVLVSMLVSLTLIPVMMNFSSGSGMKSVSSRVLDGKMDALISKYRALLIKALDHPGSVAGVGFLSIALAAGILYLLGADLVPRTDDGAFVVRMTAGEASSIDFSKTIFKDVASKIRQQKGIDSVFYQIGNSYGGSSNRGYFYVLMKPLSMRKTSEEDAIVHLRKLLLTYPAIDFSIDHLSPLGGNGTDVPIQIILQGPDRKRLASLVESLRMDLEKTKGFVDITTREGERQKLLAVVPKKNLPAGSSASELGGTLHLYLAGMDTGWARVDGRTIPVHLSMISKDLSSPSDLESLPMMTSTGKVILLGDMAMVESAVQFKRRVRDDRMPSVTLESNLSGNIPLKTALDDITQWKKDHLPGNYRLRFGGSGDVMNNAIGSFMMAIGLAIIAVFMVLASQFESFVQPFIITLSIPVSLSGAALALYLTVNSLNIMSAMGLIILFGLVAKNAILMVDYTNTLRKRGYSRRDALLAACPVRLRPILMTTVAMVAGMSPMALGIGSGGPLRAPMALVVMGGLISSMLLTLFIVPVAYDFFARWNVFSQKNEVKD
jgi:HAE1 family hydrophobic/amphiphilic exporter-1